jgi:hypothetical protein
MEFAGAPAQFEKQVAATDWMTPAGSVWDAPSLRLGAAMVRW